MQDWGNPSVFFPAPSCGGRALDWPTLLFLHLVSKMDEAVFELYFLTTSAEGWWGLDWSKYYCSQYWKPTTKGIRLECSSSHCWTLVRTGLMDLKCSSSFYLGMVWCSSSHSWRVKARPTRTTTKPQTSDNDVGCWLFIQKTRISTEAYYSSRLRLLSLWVGGITHKTLVCGWA